MRLRLLSAADVARALPMSDAIDAMREAFAQLATGRVTAPLRTRIDVAEDGVTFAMPAYAAGSGDLALKAVSVFPRNPARGLPTVQALVVVLDAATGGPLALLDGATLTALRTGGASGLATALLARPDATTVALFGAGAQARSQLEAVCHVRRIRRAWVCARRPESAARLVAELRGRDPIPADLRVAATPAEALAEADVVCTATTSCTPVFAGRDVRPGTHVNGVGSFTPEMREVDADLVRRALVVVDARESALVEAGDLVAPLREGVVGREHVHAELGELVTGRLPGRTDARQITFFKSCGLAVQDAVAAGRALVRARELGLGSEVEL